MDEKLKLIMSHLENRPDLAPAVLRFIEKITKRPNYAKLAAELTPQLASSKLVSELIEDSSFDSSATHSVPQEGRGRGRPRSGVADAVEAELLQRPAKIIDDPQVRARALNTLAQRRRRERKALQLPEPPPGFSWPKEKFDDSPLRRKHGGIIVFLREDEWAKIFAAGHVITQQILKSVDFSAWESLKGYRRSKPLPPDIRVLTDDDLAENLAAGRIRAAFTTPKP